MIEINLVEIYFGTINIISFTIATLGVFVILLGALRASKEYIIHHRKNFMHMRAILSSHLVLGLDFFIGTDIIDTLMIHPSNGNGNSQEEWWVSLVSLIIVVAIRIVVNHFLMKELEAIKQEAARKKRKKT